MNDNLARVLRPGLPAPFQADERPRIEIVSTRSQRQMRPRIVYALSATAGVSVVVVAQLLLSVGISQGAYELSTLRVNKIELGRTSDSVREDLVRVSSPQSLAANAEALGMVSDSNPAYLRLSDSAVLGAPSSATGVAGASANLVPNALLTGVPLVTQTEQAAALGTSVGVAAPDAVAAAVAADAVATAPLVAVPPQGLPTPTTR
jgi:hypothetical protein